MSKELQKKMHDGKIMIDKLKQYKFSPKTKDEMKKEFDFLFESEEKNTSSSENLENKDSSNTENNETDKKGCDSW